MDKRDMQFSENRTKGLELIAHCATCKKMARQQVVSDLQHHGNASNEDEQWQVTWTDNYQIIQCQGCDSVSFRHESQYAQALAQQTVESLNAERLYPHHSACDILYQPFYRVPANLRRVYMEVIDCFNRDNPTLCAAGLRALIAGICADQGITEQVENTPIERGGIQTVRTNSLNGQIHALWQMQAMTGVHAQGLRELRILSEEAIHELARPSQEVLRVVIGILEQVLDTLYESSTRRGRLRLVRQVRKL